MWELKAAETARYSRERADNALDALAGYEVIGIVIKKGISDPFRIERGGSSGTGTIGSIGWSDDMTLALTAALMEVFEARKKNAEGQLKQFGVEVD